MAELATIARPYAEALFKAAAGSGAALVDQLNALGAVAGNEQLRQFADSPKVGPLQVFDLIAGIALQKGLSLNVRVANLLQAVIENGRLAALPEIATQFTALVNAQSGSSDAVVYSAYPIDDAALADVVVALERRFARKLKARVEIDPELIGDMLRQVAR